MCDETIDEVLNTSEAADFLRISVQTVLKFHREKKIKGKKEGLSYKFLKSELLNFLRKKED